MEDYKEKTIKAYNKNAKKFSEKFKELMDLKRRYEFQRFIELLPGKKILDLGCGSGDHSYYFLQNGLDVSAIDISDEMIKICKQKGLNAFVMDIEDLKFDDKSFDGIWSVTSLLHIPKSELPRVIDKMYKILKDNGILYVCVKEGEGENLVKDEDGSERFFSFWKKQKILDLFKEKFSLIEFRKVKLGHTVFLQFFLQKKLGK